MEEKTKKIKEIKKQISTVEFHLCNIHNIKLQEVALNTDIKKRAIDILDKIDKTTMTYSNIKLEFDSIKTQLNNINSKSHDRIKVGWKFVGTNKVYSIKVKPPKDRKSTIQWIYKDDVSDESQTKKLESDLNNAQNRLSNAKKNQEDSKTAYNKLVTDYNAWLIKENKRLRIELK